MKKTFFIFILVLGALFHSTGRSQVDPSIQWKKVSFKNFDLIYDAQHQDLAELYAARFEGSLLKLSNIFTDIPEKTTIVLNDRTDLTNGFAAPIPRPFIMIYPALPGPMETISEYEDWADLIATHEYTHVLAMEPRRGVVKGLYYIYGRLMTPNILLPRWWHEGLAVEMETRFTKRGRLTSNYQDAALRSYSVHNLYESIRLSDINETSIPTWPYGARPYLFGSLLWSDMIAQKGTRIANELAWRQGGRAPYFINGPIEDEFQSSYLRLYSEMRDSVEKKSAQQVSQLKTVSPTTALSLNLNDLENFSPVVSPDGLKLAYIAKDDATRRLIQVLSRPSTSEPFEKAHLMKGMEPAHSEWFQESSPFPKPDLSSSPSPDGPPGGTIQRLSWFPDSERFVYDKVDDPNRFREISDLHIFNTKTTKSEQLTFNLRAREPEVSPDGQKIAYVQIQTAKTSLALFDIQTKKSEILYEPKILSRVSYPYFGRENEILFSLHESGVEKLMRLNLVTKKLDPVLQQCLQPHFGSGQLITCTNNGVSNLYKTDAEFKKLTPLTHSLTAIFTATYDSHRQEYYVSEMTSSGLRLGRIAKTDADRLPTNLPTIKPIFADRYEKVASESKVLEKSSADFTQAEDYSPWSYLIPTYWIPSVYSTGNRSAFSFSTGSSDPLSKHSYNLFAAYDDGTKKTSHSFSYLNNTTSAQVLATSSDLTYYLIDQLNEMRTQKSQILATWQLLFLKPEWEGGFGWTWLTKHLNQSHNYQLGPTLYLSYLDYTMGGAQISPESGWGGTLAYTKFLPSAGRLDYNLVEVSAVKYFSKWLRKHHVFMAKFQGQYIDRIVPAANYTQTQAFMLFTNTNLAQYLMRGYPPGTFLGRSLGVGNFEYRFPIRSIYRGSGTLPLYFKRAHAALVMDGLIAEGSAYNSKTLTYEPILSGKTYWNYGAELKVDTTVGYHIPLTWTFGVYTPADQELTKGSQFLIHLTTM